MANSLLPLYHYPWSCSVYDHTVSPPRTHLNFLNSHLTYLKITEGKSLTRSYDHGYDFECSNYLGKPSTVTFSVAGGARHTIKFSCSVGEIKNKWTAPLHVSNVSCDDKPVSFIFIQEDTAGTCDHPHVTIDCNENYVSHDHLSDIQAEDLLELVEGWKAEDDLEDQTFFQYYLSKRTDEDHVLLLLCYLPSLDIRSGK